MNKTIPHAPCRGFALIELLVTISIFIVMTGVILAKYHSFSTNADFANAVEGVALSVREAQVYGVGSKTTGGSSCGIPASTFNCVYGVSLSQGASSYIIFIDMNGDGLYDLVNDGSPVQTISLGNTLDISISDIKINGISVGVGGNLAITFKRPSPDGIINGSPSNTSTAITITKGTVSSTVTINSAGLLTIQ